MMYQPMRGPLLPPSSIERRERSWVLSAGSRQLSITRIDYRAAAHSAPQVVIRTSRGWRPTTVIGAMLGLMAGATLLGVAITSTRASAGYRYVVSVPLPPVRAAYRVAHVDPKPAPTTATLRHAVVTPKVARPVAADAQDVDYGVDDPNPVAFTAATTARAAIGAALATGRLQQWSAPDGSERGFVVVGPEEKGAGGCRALSILTRRGSENAVERRRECHGSLLSGRQDAVESTADVPPAS
jgi:hypothetical protein